MNVRTALLAPVQQVGLGVNTLYTNPAGLTTIVKFLTVASTALLAVTAEFRVDGLGGVTNRIWVASIPAGGSAQVPVYVILNPTYPKLYAASSSATGLFYSAHGTRLVGVAP